MNTYISINSIILARLFKRDKFISIGKEEIIKAVQKKSSTCSGLNRLARKIEFKDAKKNKNKYL